MRLWASLQSGRTALSAAEPASGKTTLMKALLDHVPLQERLIVIEQPAELKIAHPNAVRWEAVEAIPGQVAVTPSQLVAAALRHRPDRIIMGEIRDECGYDLLQAMNTGHGGTLSTIHAKSAWDALNRLSDLALSARPNLNHSFIRSETAEAIDFVLYCERDHAGRRRVRELITVKGYSHADQSFETEEIYRASSAASGGMRRGWNRNRYGASHATMRSRIFRLGRCAPEHGAGRLKTRGFGADLRLFAESLVRDE